MDQAPPRQSGSAIFLTRLRAKYLDTQISERFGMAAGERATGPVAVIEDETTIIVPASRDAICQPDGCIDVVLRPTGASKNVKG